MTSPETELTETHSRSIAEMIREVLARRRISRQKLADDARISISTLEKALSGRRPFTLATTIRLEEALGIPLRADLPPEMQQRPNARHAPEEFGAYSHESVTWLEGCYLTLRPAFSDLGSIFAYRTEIVWDDTAAHLVFRETQRTDPHFAQTGAVSVPNQSGAIYLLTTWQGQYRLAMLGRPNIHGEMFGILTTLQSGRGSSLTPVAAPIALLPERRLKMPMPYGLIVPSAPDFAACQACLRRVNADGYGTLFAAP